MCKATTYDQGEVVYIEMAALPVSRSVTVAENVTLDFDTEGELIGIEVIGTQAQAVADAMRPREAAA